MAKHVIKKDDSSTVEVTADNSQWLVQKGVTLSGVPTLLNEGFNDVGFVVDGKLVTTGNGVVTTWSADQEGPDNTSIDIGANGHVTADNMGLLIEGDGASVTNRGVVEAHKTGLYFFGTGMKIVNSGEIISQDHAAIGSEFGADFLIRNNGLLRGGDTTSAVVIWSAQGKLINGEGGVIDGAVNLTSSGGSTVINRGEITGETTAVQLGDDADHLVNRGAVDGEIRLMSGDDVADLRKGTLVNSVVYGGDGQDTFIIDRTDIAIVELAGDDGGSDTIRTSVSYTLGDLDTESIETLSAIGKKDIDLGGNSLNNRLFGNDGNNTMSGDAGMDTLNGFKGNDLLTGGAGDDNFYFTRKGGVDTITDFALGADDIYVDHVSGIGDFADLKSRMSSVDFDHDGDLDTVIDFGDGNRIRLTDIATDDLQMSDFTILAA